MILQLEETCVKDKLMNFHRGIFYFQDLPVKSESLVTFSKHLDYVLFLSAVKSIIECQYSGQNYDCILQKVNCLYKIFD